MSKPAAVIAEKSEEAFWLSMRRLLLAAVDRIDKRYGSRKSSTGKGTT